MVRSGPPGHAGRRPFAGARVCRDALRPARRRRRPAAPGCAIPTGRDLLDYIGAWGPALLGHAHPAVEAAVVAAARRGLVFGLASPPEVDLAERIVARVPGCEMVRFVVTGTEATMSAVRVARAATGRRVIVKFAGAYHGHADMFLVSAGSGAATFGTPDSPGVTPGAVQDTAIARFNDLASVDRCFAEAEGGVAAVILEPVVGNMGCVPPADGFLDGLRVRAAPAHGAVLIFDEVMTGFRVARGGAAERYGVTPDLVTLGKIAGGGVPLAAFGGRADLMRHVAPSGPVYQAGTYAAHPLAVAAGLATLDVIDADARSLRRARSARRQAPGRPAAGRGRGRRARVGAACRLDVDGVLLGHARSPRGTTPPAVNREAFARVLPRHARARRAAAAVGVRVGVPVAGP